MTLQSSIETSTKDRSYLLISLTSENYLTDDSVRISKFNVRYCIQSANSFEGGSKKVELAIGVKGCSGQGSFT
jgi:ACR3 family arsenite efflux pump ArsB